MRISLYEILIQPIPETPLLAGQLAQTYQIRQIKPGDPELDLMPARPEIKVSRFAQNAMCLGTFKKNKLVAYIWLAFGSYEEDEARCTFVLPPHAVFDFDLYVMPECRMTLAFAGTWHGANEFLLTRGIRNSFSRLTRTNIRSRRAHKRLGAARIAHTLFVKAWKLELMLASIAPYVHLSLTERNRVHLNLREDATKSAL
ncbi:MAG TPA: hypothetical protein VN577_20830 [Terriglobales bacterium]|nr:hypothetical protein [Terriglobales bacterium]